MKNEIIKCPECELIQLAEVKQTLPWKTRVHVCISCGYIIGESEWDEEIVNEQELKEYVDNYLKERFGATTGNNPVREALIHGYYLGLKWNPITEEKPKNNPTD
jgi:NMD protein affecting ribosome stability and mRNA decay